MVSLIANAQTTIGNDDLFFNNLIQKLNNQDILKKQNLKFTKILPYKCKVSPRC